MALPVIVRGAARVEATDAADWYEVQTPGDAARFLDGFVRFLADIGQNPGRYGRVRRPPAGHEVRQGLLRPFARLITYEVTVSHVIVLSVTHARQRSQPWRRRVS